MSCETCRYWQGVKDGEGACHRFPRVDVLGGNHGEHWYALDVLAHMYEKLERRVRELEGRDS